MITDLPSLAAAIPDGTLLAIPADYGGPSLAVTLELIRRKRRGLRLVTAPTSGLQADLLIGAGVVTEIETAGVSLGEYGAAERFRAAWAAGTITVRDSTCPALHAGFQAAEKGVPFLPLRGILGSDLLTLRPDWKVISNPLADEPDPIVVVPAIRPEVALFHAPLADRHGNVWIGMRRELATLAHASSRTLVTAEELYPGNLLDDPLRAPGTLPHLYVDQAALVPGGSWPLGLGESVPADPSSLALYAEAARTESGFADIVREWLHG